LEEGIETDHATREKTDFEIFFLFLSGTGGKNYAEYEKSQIEQPTMIFFSIAKPKVGIDIAIDPVGNECPDTKKSNPYQVFFCESSCTKKEYRCYCYEYEKKQHFHFFKTTEEWEYISESHRNSWDIDPCIDNRNDYEKEREASMEAFFGICLQGVHGKQLFFLCF